MFSNLLIVALAAIVLWIGLFVVYLRASSQQQTIEKELNTLDEMLRRNETDHV